MYVNGAFATTPSSYLVATADTYPLNMTDLSLLEIHPYNISFQWEDLTDRKMNGRDEPTFYQVEFWNASLNAWVILNAGGPKVLNYTHVITDKVFDYSKEIKYRVLPWNGVGKGVTYSSELIIHADTQPIGMNPMFIISVEPYKIVVGWPELSEDLNGGEEPIYYECEWFNITSNQWVKMIDNINAGKLYQITHAQTD